MENYENINFTEFKNEILKDIKQKDLVFDDKGGFCFRSYNTESIQDIENMTIDEISVIFNDIKIKYLELIENFNKNISNIKNKNQ